MSELSHEEILEIRKDVQSRYTDLEFPDVVLEPLWFGRRPDTRIPNRYAIVDQNTDLVFNVCTDMYKPIYHELIIKMVEDAAHSLPEFGNPEIKVSLLADGGKLKVNCRFPEVDYEIKVGDVVNPTMDILSSYDLGWKYKGMFGAYRLICSNGARVGTVFDSFKNRHLVGLDATILSNTMLSGMTRFSEQTALWSTWAEEKIPAVAYEELWGDLSFSPTEREKIEATPEAATKLLLPEAVKSGELTRWDLFNVLTQFTTHEIKSELRQVELFPEITKIVERIKI